jgi:3-hydroxymyristoyl/3-hydroxydecanoyl-(acyl carrier protein) dehydratase
MFAVALLAALAAAACGGADTTDTAAGSAPGAESAGANAATVASTDATVYVVHGINGRDLGARTALPVDVAVNGVCAIRHLRFRGIVGPLALAAGTYDVEVHLVERGKTACGGATAISAKGLKLAAGSNVSIVAHLAEAVTPSPTASVFANDVTADPGKARLIARHAANFGAVDVYVDGAPAFQGVMNGQQGAAGVSPGKHTVAITPAGSSTKAFEESLRLRPSNVYAAYAVGTPANGTFEVLLQTLRMEKAASVYVVHGINGKDLGAPEALPVEVSVDGGCAITQLKFKDIVGPIALKAGTYDIEVHLVEAGKGPCQGATAISAKGVAIEAGSNVSVVAHLADATPAKPTATVFANDLRPAGFRARVIARHAANFGPVDVYLDSSPAFEGVKNGEQGVAKVWPGKHAVAITPAGSTTKAFEATLHLDPFKVYAGYAVGTPANGTFDVLLQAIPVAFDGHRGWWWNDDED